MTQYPAEPGSPAKNGSPITPPAIWFESLTFSDGTTISLDAEDIVVFIGPNNAGKSAALRELELFIGSASPKQVIKSAQIKRTATVAQVLQYLELCADKRGIPPNESYRGMGFSIRINMVAHGWERSLELFRPLLCMRIATETRITDSNNQDAIYTLEQSPSHPIHLLYADDRVERRLSGYFERAFGKELIVFRGGGSKIPLMVGTRPVLRDGEDRVSATYIERLIASAQTLDTQGDGMRSFASVILKLFAPSTQSVILLDEPEAFLHPPQARLLGEFIARERRPRTQLFVATHSADVLHGLLQVAPEQLRILRIEREGSINHVKELDKKNAREIGTDPLMKFSSVLLGVFHERVIICESDADCLFYSVLLDLPDIHGSRHPDVLFIHAGGKHRMAALAEALRSLGVAVDVIADMDLLRDDVDLEKTVRALGGDWDEVKSQAEAVRKAIEEHKPWLNSAEVAKGISEILKKAPSTGGFPKELRKEIDAIFKKASPWDVIKDAGEQAIPAGQPMQHYKALKSLCSSCGLWIVPVGELEGFCKSIGGHGPKWVQNVISTFDLGASEELTSARKFVKEIWESRARVG